MLATWTICIKEYKFYVCMCLMDLDTTTSLLAIEQRWLGEKMFDSVANVYTTNVYTS